ncbi:MAG TPA: hypothetical protein PKC18_00950 [Lacipirellulaceae bacterium]|nr:hypothetical protein [Lacipirellulaceae bacterium]
MAILTIDERQALRSMRDGGHLPAAVFNLLVEKKLVSQSPIELTPAGRAVCELLQELDALKLADDSATRGEY